MEKQSTSSSSSSWIRGSCIGRGCFGTVSKAVSKIDGEVFAVKSVDLATCLPSQSESLENEIAILRSLKTHPHIVRFLDDDVSNEGTTSFRNLHLEYLPEGDVANVGKIVNDETLLRRYVWCLVSALGHVHANEIVHCDVKSKNVLVVNGGSFVKLADFGSAMELEKPAAEIAPRGSPLWMAPEVVRREYQGPESDVWSLGCTVVEMLTGKPAWEDHGFDSLSRIGFSNELPFIPAGVSELCRDFLDKCLRRDRRQRWSCEQLLEHPFLCQDHHHLLFTTESSPRCVLDWVNSEFEEEEQSDELRVESMVSAMARISKLATIGGEAIWESNGWTEVRGNASEESGAQWEYPSSTRAESELNISPESTGDTGTRTVNEDSELTSVITCEILSLMVLLVVENIQIYATFYTNVFIRILYSCYHNQNNKKTKLRKNLSFILSLNFLFGIACDSDRSIYLMKTLLREKTMPGQKIETGHEDTVHDVQMDYYGKRVATASSDCTIKITGVSNNGASQHLATLTGHRGPVWEVAWAHPKFGSMLASCSYDGQVILWKEGSQNQWTQAHVFTDHKTSVNSIAWAPYELGLSLACGSSDGNISVFTGRGDGGWDTTKIDQAHPVGVTSVSWAPSTAPGALVSSGLLDPVYKLASGGCDNTVKVWKLSNGSWKMDCFPALQKHTDWVRGVAWAPNLGLPKSTIASGSQDGKVVIWTVGKEGEQWEGKVLNDFKAPVWRVSWSLTGNLLAVSDGNNNVTVWKEAVDGEWQQVTALEP
ncbi:unnamed protein product [Brassica oleracea]